MTDYKSLCVAVEQDVRRALSAPSDFKWLSQQIEERTGEHVSHTTLMRMWGYLPGVMPRKVTLNILARFLGYTGFDEFREKSLNSLTPDSSLTPNPSPRGEGRSYCQEEGKTTDSDGPTHDSDEAASTKVSTPLAFGRGVGDEAILFFLLIGTIIFLFLLLRRPTAHQTPYRIASISQLSNKKQYRISTLNDVRGALGVTNRQLANNWERAQNFRCDTASTFAILRHEDAYYLYSVADHRFINYFLQETDAPLCDHVSAMDILVRDSLFVLDFHATKGPFTLNFNEGNGVIITDYGTVNGAYDDGTQLVIEEMGDFDPTEALAMLKEPNKEFEAAVKAIKADGAYAIYTESNGKRYYLCADGYLTEARTDSCRFILHRISGWEFCYRSPSFMVCHHASPADTCHVNFTSSFENGELLRTGHLNATPYSYDYYHCQTFFLDKNGRYAIRCTAASTEGKAAGHYWSACDINGDGRLDADYAKDRAYIWQLELEKNP